MDKWTFYRDISMDTKTINEIDIIEDNSQLRKLFLVCAKKSGYTAKGYLSAEHYLEYVNSANYTSPTLAVITDIRMPGMSGYELMSEIKKITPLQRFVVITGTPEDCINKAVRACFYLTKPVSVEKMQAIFEKLASTSSNCIKCKSEAPLCKSLSDLSAFKIKDWNCPRENISTH